MISLNVNGLKKILNSKSSFKKIVLLSTMSVYGEIKSNFVTENTKKKNLDKYGKSKLEMEKLLLKFCKKKK